MVFNYPVMSDFFIKNYIKTKANEVLSFLVFCLPILLPMNRPQRALNNSQELVEKWQQRAEPKLLHFQALFGVPS